MRQYTKYDFASDLVVIHKVISRALDVAVDKGPTACAAQATNPAMFNGYIQYVECTMRQLHEHHSNEDAVAFPMLRKLFPQGPYDRLESQHSEMIHIVEHVEALIAAAKGQTPSPDMQDPLLEDLERLRASWQAHIADEEGHLGPDGISPSISMKDRVRIGKASVRYASFHSSPIALMIPFMLYNLEAGDRAIMASTIPSFLSKFFVPVVWRSRWALMRPYLLVE